MYGLISGVFVWSIQQGILILSDILMCIILDSEYAHNLNVVYKKH